MKTRIVPILITLLCAVMASVQSASPAIIMVTNTNDSGLGSLRDVLASANDGDTIDATGVSGTILLTSGELQINHNVTIKGPGAGKLSVNGNAAFRVFENFASQVTISGFTITNGLVANGSGGAGILNHGELTLSDSIVSHSTTFALGNQPAPSAAFPTPPPTPTPTPGPAGGIFNMPGATLTVTGSTINGNVGSCEGGGIYASDANLTVVNSTISDNEVTAGFFCDTGGGISAGGTVTVTNSVISGNSSGWGGGMSVSGNVSVTDSTISG